MATFDEVYLARELQEDLSRLLPNLVDEIATIRAVITAGGTPSGQALTNGAKGMLGRLKRVTDFAQAFPAKTTAALSIIGVTQAHLTNWIVQLRDALRIFRDAPKADNTQITAALNTLEAAIPVQRRFLKDALPGDW